MLTGLLVSVAFRNKCERTGHRPENGTVPVNMSRCERYTNEWNGTGTGPASTEFSLVLIRLTSLQSSWICLSQLRPNSEGPLPGTTNNDMHCFCPLYSTSTSAILTTGITSPVYVGPYVISRLTALVVLCKLSLFTSGSLKLTSGASPSSSSSLWILSVQIWTHSAQPRWALGSDKSYSL